MQRLLSTQSWIQQKAIDGHQNQTQIALVELVEELLECSGLVTVHTVDVLNQVCIQSFVVVLFSLTSNTISIK